MRFLITTLNCIKLRSFRYFKLLYNEFPHEIYIHNIDWSCFTINALGVSISIDRKDRIHNSTALLHEIGHYIDYRKTGLEHFAKESHEIKKEKEAWKWAIRLSKKYDIEISPKLAKKWLSTYNTNYRVLDNLCEKVEK